VAFVVVDFVMLPTEMQVAVDVEEVVVAVVVVVTDCPFLYQTWLDLLSIVVVEMVVLAAAVGVVAAAAGMACSSNLMAVLYFYYILWRLLVSCGLTEPRAVALDFGGPNEKMAVYRTDILHSRLVGRLFEVRH
jgi:hypothetical protein